MCYVNKNANFQQKKPVSSKETYLGKIPALTFLSTYCTLDFKVRGSTSVLQEIISSKSNWQSLGE